MLGASIQNLAKLFHHVRHSLTLVARTIKHSCKLVAENLIPMTTDGRITRRHSAPHLFLLVERV